MNSKKSSITLFSLIFFLAQATLAIAMDDVSMPEKEIQSDFSRDEAKQAVVNLSKNSQEHLNEFWIYVEKQLNSMKNQESTDSSSTKQTENESESNVVTVLEKKSQSFVHILSSDEAKKYGLGAVALVVVGTTTYILYKNGTLKKLAQGAKRHPHIALSLGAATGLVVVYYYRDAEFVRSLYDRAKSFMPAFKQNA